MGKKKSKEQLVKLDQEVLKNAGVNMSVTKNDMIDMLLLRMEEDLEGQIQEKKQELIEHLGVKDQHTSQQIHYHGCNGFHDYQTSDTEKIMKKMVLDWVKENHPQVQKIIGDDLWIRFLGDEVQLATKHKTGESFFTWNTSLQKIETYQKFRRAKNKIEDEIHQLKCQLHEIQNGSSRKLRVQVMEAVLGGSEAGKEILGVLDAMSPRANYKKGLPKPKVRK